MPRRAFSILAAPLSCLLLSGGSSVEAFVGRHQTGTQSSRFSAVADDDVLLYSDEFEDGVPPDENENEDSVDTNVPWKKNARWNSLNPKVKARMVLEAQERAIRNKQKREPADAKKRRLLMLWRKSQRGKKRASRVKRTIPFDERTPLSTLEVGMETTGTVISLTNFGAYVDIGTECDGLLHISQISNTVFVEHPRQVMTPGDEVVVRVTSINPERKKLQLSMLPESERDDDDDEVDDEERILLEEVAIDDELWGEIRRVTAYGAYVELGAEVDGFLHFMDHPEFSDHLGEPPSAFMATGDRIRAWVSNIDMDKRRIQLTANRPTNLPGPRREIY